MLYLYFYRERSKNMSSYFVRKKRGSGNRILWTILVTNVFLLSCLLAFGGNTREFETSAGKNLEIDLNMGGTVEIEGWTKPLISVKTDMDKEDTDGIKYDHYNGNLKISDSFFNNRGRGRLNLIIKVPDKFNIDIQTMGGGITINHVEGKLIGVTMGGEIELSDLKGSIQFSTMGGEIRLRSSTVDGEVKTMGGEVELLDVIGKIKGSTMGGDVHFRNPNLTKAKGDISEVEMSTMGGDIEVDSAPLGANINTMGGDLRIGSAGGYVKAKTMGGDIIIEEIDGWVKASTMGGDVEVKMIGDVKKGKRDVDLSSKGGDIILTVPDRLSMEFDIKLIYTKNSDRDFEIESDFPVKIEESEEWDYSSGSPKKYIYGTGRIGDGKNRIKLETINGDIRIIKGD
jgi:DUF4097 and DUF4098 domain-containing protein YvlB